MAHLPDDLVSGLCLLSAGRQPDGEMASVGQRAAGLSAQRSVAWRGLDLPRVGRVPRRGAAVGTRRPPAPALGRGGHARGPGVDPLVGLRPAHGADVRLRRRGLGFLPIVQPPRSRGHPRAHRPGAAPIGDAFPAARIYQWRPAGRRAPGGAGRIRRGGMGPTEGAASAADVGLGLALALDDLRGGLARAHPLGHLRQLAVHLLPILSLMARFLAKAFALALAVLGLLALLFARYHRQFPPADNYFLAAVDKQRLVARQPSPRLIFVGGSSMAFGLDSAAVAQACGYHPVNMG